MWVETEERKVEEKERKRWKVAEARSGSSEWPSAPSVCCTQGLVALQSLFKPITATGARLCLPQLNTEYLTLTSHLFSGYWETRQKVPASKHQLIEQLLEID